MRSKPSKGSLGLRLAAIAGLLFLHLPILLIFLYAFTTEDRSYVFPPPGLTLKWFGVTWARPDVWDALQLSVTVAAISTVLALVLGTLCAAAVSRSHFFRPRKHLAAGHTSDRVAGHHHRHLAALRLQYRGTFRFRR